MRYFWFATKNACGLLACDEAGVVQGALSAPYYRKAFGGMLMNHIIMDERKRGRPVQWMELEPHE